MRLLLSVFLLSSLMLFTHCQDKSMESFTMGEPFILNMNEMNLNPDALMTIQFLEVKEDSRCPQDVTCIWEGRVVAVLQAEIGGGKTKETFLLATVNKQKDAGTAITVGEYKIELMSVLPARGVQANEIAKESYQLQLKVTKAPNTQ